jgi:hypothetical protein
LAAKSCVTWAALRGEAGAVDGLPYRTGAVVHPAGGHYGVGPNGIREMWAELIQFILNRTGKVLGPPTKSDAERRG